MKRRHYFKKILFVIGMIGLISNSSLGQSPMGKLQLTSKQRSCLEKMGRPGSGSRPSREKMESTFRECGIKPHPGLAGRPKQPAKYPSKEVEAGKARIDPETVIEGLQSLRGKKMGYLRLAGKIPRACREKIGVNMTCSEGNKVFFTLNELTQDGFRCLKNNQSQCQDESSTNKCISFEKLSKDNSLRKNFSIRLDSAASGANSCKDIDIASVRIAILKSYYDPASVETESGFCIDCNQDRQFKRLESQLKDLRAIVEKQNTMLAKRPDMPDGPPGKKSRIKKQKRGDDFDKMPIRGRPQGSSPRGMAQMGGGNALGMSGLGGGMSMLGGMNSMRMMGGMGSMGSMSNMYSRSPYMNYSPYSRMLSGQSRMSSMVGAGGMNSMLYSSSPYMNYSPYSSMGWGNSGSSANFNFGTGYLGYGR